MGLGAPVRTAEGRRPATAGPCTFIRLVYGGRGKTTPDFEN